jgi:serine protease Do
MTEVSGQRSSTFGGWARSKRFVLLGTAAALVLGGAVLGNSGLMQDVWTTPARAETGSVAPLPANAFSFADVVDHVRGAVVSIKVKIAQTAAVGESDDGPQLSPDDPLERFFRHFGGEEGTPFVFRHGRPHVEMAQGSGFIISPDGYVVTNNHVVDHASEVTITMDDGTTHPAKVIGTDKRTDLALLKIKSGGPFKYVGFAAKQPRVGDWVIAVGNPFGLGGTVTAGIVSARGRDINSGPYDDYLQIDAPVNRGNSGGPTFNTQGEVVGINTAIYSPSGGSVGIGFDIPADEAKGVIAALESKGVVTRGWIGVQIQPVTSDIADSLGLKGEKGALVADTEKDSPASKAGIKTGDVILGVNGEPVDSPRELARKIAGLGPNVDASLLVWHDGAQKTYDVKLGTLPNDRIASAETGSGDGTDSGAAALANFGLTLAPSDSVPGAVAGGVVITNIDPDGAAAQKGLKVGDVILQAGGKSVTSPSQVADVLSDAKKAGRKAILLRIKSGDETHFVALELGKAS